MTPSIKNKQDLIRALQGNALKFVGEYEAVNDGGLRAATDKVKNLIRQNKKLQLILLERD